MGVVCRALGISGVVLRALALRVYLDPGKPYSSKLLKEIIIRNPRKGRLFGIHGRAYLFSAYYLIKRRARKAGKGLGFGWWGREACHVLGSLRSGHGLWV